MAESKTRNQSTQTDIAAEETIIRIVHNKNGIQTVLQQSAGTQTAQQGIEDKGKVVKVKSRSKEILEMRQLAKEWREQEERQREDARLRKLLHNEELYKQQLQQRKEEHDIRYKKEQEELRKIEEQDEETFRAMRTMSKWKKEMKEDRLKKEKERKERREVIEQTDLQAYSEQLADRKSRIKENRANTRELQEARMDKEWHDAVTATVRREAVKAAEEQKKHHEFRKSERRARRITYLINEVKKIDFEKERQKAIEEIISDSSEEEEEEICNQRPSTPTEAQEQVKYDRYTAEIVENKFAKRIIRGRVFITPLDDTTDWEKVEERMIRRDEMKRREADLSKMSDYKRQYYKRKLLSGEWQPLGPFQDMLLEEAKQEERQRK